MGILQGVDLIQGGSVINIATPPNIKRTFYENLRTLHCINIPLHLQEFSCALPLGTPSGKGANLTVYPSSRPNMDTDNDCTVYSWTMYLNC